MKTTKWQLQVQADAGYWFVIAEYTNYTLAMLKQMTEQNDDIIEQREPRKYRICKTIKTHF